MSKQKFYPLTKPFVWNSDKPAELTIGGINSSGEKDHFLTFKVGYDGFATREQLEHVVHCVNLHDEMLSLLREIYAELAPMENERTEPILDKIEALIKEVEGSHE